MLLGPAPSVGLGPLPVIFTLAGLSLPQVLLDALPHFLGNLVPSTLLVCMAAMLFLPTERLFALRLPQHLCRSRLDLVGLFGLFRRPLESQRLVCCLALLHLAAQEALPLFLQVRPHGTILLFPLATMRLPELRLVVDLARHMRLPVVQADRDVVMVPAPGGGLPAQPRLAAALDLARVTLAEPAPVRGLEPAATVGVGGLAAVVLAKVRVALADGAAGCVGAGVGGAEAVYCACRRRAALHGALVEGAEGDCLGAGVGDELCADVVCAGVGCAVVRVRRFFGLAWFEEALVDGAETGPGPCDGIWTAALASSCARVVLAAVGKLLAVR